MMAQIANPSSHQEVVGFLSASLLGLKVSTLQHTIEINSPSESESLASTSKSVEHGCTSSSSDDATSQSCGWMPSVTQISERHNRKDSSPQFSLFLLLSELGTSSSISSTKASSSPRPFFPEDPLGPSKLLLVPELPPPLAPLLSPLLGPRPLCPPPPLSSPSPSPAAPGPVPPILAPERRKLRKPR